MEPTIRAVLFDFGGVILSSPFEAFAHYEAANGLPDGFLRGLNARNHHHNAWALLERNEVGFGQFCELFEAEARQAGHEVDAAAVIALLAGDVRPEMVEAVRRCRERCKTGLLTNNFVAPDGGVRLDEVLALFDVIIESSKVGVRKPDPRFYRMACDELGIEPAEAVFLDDLGINLKPAREMGMTTIKVTDPAIALAELESVLGFSLR
ncbi:MAG TPA: HAD-IA family hydrolase [Acidimicrobiales bacterium]|nr:HAD-IA family hydrolase [Acidimicrobiales bacterium]